MEDSFRVRVEKTFGSLSSVSASSSASASAPAPAPAPASFSNLWYLSDEEIERREWNRRDRRDSPSPDDEPPQPNHPLSDLDVVKPLSLDRNNVLDAGCPGPGPGPSEDWEIRSSIGLDCTLDNEEEEDEFDKVAVGHEELGDHFYTRDIDDYGIDYPDLISSSFDDSVVRRDPRANRMAAKLRLIEDSKAAGDFDSSKPSNDSAPPSVKQHVKDEISLKPILKKRETPMDTRSHKRVRFVNMSSTGGAEGSPSQGCSEEATLLLEEEETPQEPTLLGETKDAKTSFSMDEATAALQTEVSCQVPDYIQNPSRYTLYTLDSADDVDEASNKKAYLDFYNLLRKPKDADLQPDDFDPSFPMSVVFTPKKKIDDTCSLKMDTMCNPIQGEVLKDTSVPVAIAAANPDDDGVCAMDEDLKEDAPDHSRGSRKPSRQYRTRATVDY